MKRSACTTTLVLIALTACGGDGGSGNSDVPLLGEAADPAGDNTAEASPATDPDVVAVHVDVKNGVLRAFADFAPGTLDGSSQITFAFDLDQDETTGYTGGALGILGPEFMLNLGPDEHATLYHFSGGSFIEVPIGGVTVQTATRLETVVPMSALNHDDGRLNFKTTVDVDLGGGNVSAILDRAPEFTALAVQVH